MHVIFLIFIVCLQKTYWVEHILPRFIGFADLRWPSRVPIMAPLFVRISPMCFPKTLPWHAIIVSLKDAPLFGPCKGSEHLSKARDTRLILQNSDLGSVATAGPRFICFVAEMCRLTQSIKFLFAHSSRLISLGTFPGGSLANRVVGLLPSTSITLFKPASGSNHRE